MKKLRETNTLSLYVDIFEHLNEGYGMNEAANNTAEMEKHLAERKKEKEALRQQILTE